MTISLNAFGAFEGFYSTELNNMTEPNGFGKTTIVNAYVFALTGKTLPGFQARNVYADTDTFVTLSGFISSVTYGGDIRRKITDKGTQLYIGDDAMTQTDFEHLCSQHGISIPFCASLANVNVLTDPALTSESLRKFLSASGVYEGDEAAALRARLKKVRADLKQAEQYALTAVTVPPVTCEPLTVAEKEFSKDYVNALGLTLAPIKTTCPTCGHAYAAEVITQHEKARADAFERVENGREEYTRITTKESNYREEQRRISEAHALIATARKAREDVQRLRTELAELETQSRQADERAIAADLPAGVEVRTDGRAQVSLFYNGVPLKSVNRGKRIELCVRMMDTARRNKGLLYIAPILVDNAESVQGIDDIQNVIKFTVG